MDKLKMQTENIVDENIEFIGKKFPNCVVEAKDETGKVTKMIDFDLLKQELSKVVVEGDKERYQMTWPDKKQAILTANSPIAKTLRPCKEKSVDFDNTKNIYIEGDNLDVLKLLRETYLGKVKMIYIDPPYNTGNDFVYNDDFATDTDEYLERSNQVDEQGNRMVANNESNGRFHTGWLNMIYPRLKVAKDMLSDDGVIFISIDDNEQENLKKICNEIFGEDNFVACFKWNRVAKAPSLSNSVRTKFEYVLCYYKLNHVGLFGKESYNKQGPLWHLPNKRNELFFPPHSIRVKQSFPAGMYGGTYQVELLDDLICEDGFNKSPIRVFACSAWGQQKINEYTKQGNSFEIKTNPQTFYVDLVNDNNYIAPSDLINYDECGVFNNTQASDELKKMNIPFDYSKPVSLINYCCKMGTKFDSDAIIIDFFSGSATTAHAVMQLNAEDGGNRKFIMVQLPEICDEKSEAYKAGYKNICEIGEERIRRAGNKIANDIKNDTLFKDKTKLNQLSIDDKKSVLRYEIDAVDENRQDLAGKKIPDVGFRVFKLDSSNMKDTYYKPSEYNINLLDSLDENIKPDRTPEDLLFQVMLDLGLMLDSKIEEKNINDKKVFIVGEYNEMVKPDLICCFDSNVDNSTVTEIAKMQPRFAVFRDSSMAKDSVAVNFDQIFETYSPSTTRKVL